MPSSKWWWLLIPVLLALLPAVWLFIQARLSERPAEVGLREGKLRPCPDSPNCVSSEADSEPHQMSALPYSGSTEDAVAALKRVIEEMPRGRLVSSEGRYLHAEFHTPLLGFVDDVELLVDPDASVVRFRSASRVGYSDLGVNRSRMERFGQRFSATLGRDDDAAENGGAGGNQSGGNQSGGKSVGGDESGNAAVGEAAESDAGMSKENSDR